MEMMKLVRIIRDRRSVRVGLAVAFLYFLVYMFSVGNLIPGTSPGPFLRVVDGWQSKMFRATAPFLWESVASLNLGIVTVFISVPNLVLAGALSLLVLLNISTAMYTYYSMPIRPGLKGLIALVPSLFTGFVCCVPTFIVTLGTISATFTVFFIEIRQYLIPFSIVVMALNLVWSLKQVDSGLMELYEENKAQSADS
jgi:hypothetical protein